MISNQLWHIKSILNEEDGNKRERFFIFLSNTLIILIFLLLSHPSQSPSPFILCPLVIPPLPSRLHPASSSVSIWETLTSNTLFCDQSISHRGRQTAGHTNMRTLLVMYADRHPLRHFYQRCLTHTGHTYTADKPRVIDSFNLMWTAPCDPTWNMALLLSCYCWGSRRSSLHLSIESTLILPALPAWH